MTHDIRNDTGRNRYIPCTGAVDLEHTEIAESHAGRVWPANWPATPSATSATAGSTP